MKIIADSSSTRTEWALVDGHDIVEHAFTTGLNPFFQSRREISHSIRLELPDVFFRRRWEHIYFYGAGCASKDKCKAMESSLVAQFKTPVTVESDILGAARGLLVREPGLACILGTGSNSCLYNGREIVKAVLPLGYILGDEGSAAYLGKKMLSDMLKGVAPEDLTEEFFKKFSVTPNALLDQIYTNSLPSHTLSRYSTFLSEHIDNAYCQQLVYSAFMTFFMRNITAYAYREHPLCLVGSVCVLYKDILLRAAADFGVEIAKIERYSMPGLIKFHADE
ncbi:MAG: hypothetical protein J1F05_05280 [Muribaculaceae bacterium]|nr:hypothetical protein [Muribaculaceae bacterium]